MTAQIGDQFRYKGGEYTIVPGNAPMPFDPIDYGIVPAAACTACWRGYWCVYNVSEDGVFLADLYINSADDNYPAICGVFPEKRDEGDYLSYMGHQQYKGLNIKIPYTGKLLIGDNFIQRYYIHMGFQRPWAYRKLVELVFEKGRLVEVNNHSRIAAQVRRNEIVEDYYMPKLVSQCIKPKRKIKVWWYYSSD